MPRKINPSFNIIDYNKELINSYMSKRGVQKGIKAQVHKAFWHDFYNYPNFENFQFRYSESPSNLFEIDCKILGEILLSGYDSFVQKEENKKKVRQNFINNYFINQKEPRCQFCGQLLEQSSKSTDSRVIADLEHILPKSQYPQFALHPNNLVPCCLECNQREKVDKFLELNEFIQAKKDLKLNFKRKPLELYKIITFDIDDYYSFTPSSTMSKEALKFLNLYGLEVRFKKQFNQCFNILMTRIRSFNIKSPEALESFLENDCELAFQEYQGVVSFNNSPHIYQDFINSILYDRNRLVALWEEVKSWNEFEIY